MPDLPKVGDRIRLIEMPNDPCPVEPGSTGTVTKVHVLPEPMPMSRSVWENNRPVQTGLPAPDLEAEVYIDWDHGRGLHLLVPGDTFEIIEEA